MTKQEINEQIKADWTARMQRSADTLSESILDNYENWVQQQCQAAIAARQQQQAVPAQEEQS